MTQLLLSNINIIIAVILAVSLTIMFFTLAPYMYRNKRKQYVAGVEIAKTAGDIGGSILRAIDKDPSQRNIIEKVFFHAETLVKIADVLPNFDETISGLSHDVANARRHEFVKSHIINALNSEGVVIEEELIDSSIALVVKFLLK